MKDLKPEKRPGAVLFSALPAAWGPGCAVGGEVATIGGIECLFRNILRTILPIAGLAVGIMVIVAGFQLITAGGEKGAEKAKNTFTYAIGGLVAVILVWFILVFIEKFTGITVTQFEIKP